MNRKEMAGTRQESGQRHKNAAPSSGRESSAPGSVSEQDAGYTGAGGPGKKSRRVPT